tara:strand:- start:196 stop:720 length:525 start_codon:yes stop_codon:yes gene_type:complete
MEQLILKSKLTKKLGKKEILAICRLKNTHWKHGIRSQINWFHKNIKANDIHNLAFLRKKLVGFVSLRKRKFLLKNRKKNYLYFDTLIVSKQYRKLNIGHQLLILTTKIIKKSKLHSMLLCKKKIIPFYKKYKWKEVSGKKFKILDHTYSKNSLMMCFNKKINISKLNKDYYISN